MGLAAAGPAARHDQAGAHWRATRPAGSLCVWQAGCLLERSLQSLVLCAFIIPSPAFASPHRLQAHEGDDKLGRQLRGADPATQHLVEAARAQVGGGPPPTGCHRGAGAAWRAEHPCLQRMAAAAATPMFFLCRNPPCRSCACTPSCSGALQPILSGGQRRQPDGQVGISEPNLAAPARAARHEGVAAQHMLRSPAVQSRSQERRIVRPARLQLGFTVSGLVLRAPPPTLQPTAVLRLCLTNWSGTRPSLRASCRRSASSGWVWGWALSAVHGAASGPVEPPGRRAGDHRRGAACRPRLGCGPCLPRPGLCMHSLPTFSHATLHPALCAAGGGRPGRSPCWHG